MAMEQTLAIAAQLKTAADKLIAKCSGHDATIAQMTQELADADRTAATAIQPTLDAITAADPA